MGNAPSATTSRSARAHSGFSRSWQEAAGDLPKDVRLKPDENLEDPGEIVYGVGCSSPRTLAQQGVTILEKFVSTAVDGFDLASNTPKVVHDDPYLGRVVEILRRAGAKKGLDFDVEMFNSLERVHVQKDSGEGAALTLGTEVKKNRFRVLEITWNGAQVRTTSIGLLIIRGRYVPFDVYRRTINLTDRSTHKFSELRLKFAREPNVANQALPCPTRTQTWPDPTKRMIGAKPL
jgi:hypothetical protein